MSPEIMTMLGVGVVITAFLWRAMTDMEHRLDKRFDRLESKVDGLATDYGSLAQEVAEIRGCMGAARRTVRGIRPQGAAGRRSGGGIRPYSAAAMRPREVSRSTSSR